MMSEICAQAALRKTFADFAREHAEAYRLVAEADFVLKVALGLAWSGEALELSRFAGIGGIGVALERTRPTWPQLVGARRRALDLLRVEFEIQDKGKKKLQDVRNELFHGKLYSDVELAALADQVRSSLRTAIDGIVSDLVDIDFHGVLGATTLRRRSFPEQPPSPVWPLACLAPESGSLAILTPDDDDQSLLFAGPTAAQVSAGTVTEALSAHQGLFAPTIYSEFRTFYRRVRRDIEDLSGGKGAFAMSHEGTALLATWDCREADEDVSRVDVFRLGPDNRYEWRPDGASSWVQYTAFLKASCRWERLASLLADKFEVERERLRRAEAMALPLPPWCTPPTVPATFALERFGDTETRLQGYTGSGARLTDRVDADLASDSGYVQVYFLHAAAGAGKTTELLGMAAARAREVAADPMSQRPLYLYVSARGNVLEHLEQAIAVALDGVRVVDSRSINVLLRNGAMALVVDGFDELLGSARYADPLVALRPTFDVLRGRGVLIVSARSSYLEGLYRPSDERGGDLAVRHSFLRMDLWEKEQVERYLSGVGLSPIQVRTVLEADSDLASTPFFARAIASMTLVDQVEPNAVLSEILFALARRERDKLIGSDRLPLLSEAQVTSLLTEIADYIAQQQENYVDWSELQFIAESIGLFSDILESRKREIVQRLRTLCGISVFGADRFAFHHDAFQEGYLGLAIAAAFDDSLEAGAARIDRVSVSDLVARTVAARIGQLQYELLCANGAERPRRMDASRTSWGSVLQFASCQRFSLPSAVRDVVFDEITIGAGGLITLDKCIADAVTIASGAKHAELRGCTIRELRVADPTDLQGLAVTDCIIQALFIPGEEYAEDPVKIATLILDNGGSTDVRVEVDEYSRVDRTRAILRRLEGARKSFFVVHEDYSPTDDPMTRWALRDADAWTEVVRTLCDTGLAHAVNFPTKGRTKLRVGLSADMSAVATGGGDSPGSIGEFWRAIEQSG